MNIQTQNFTNVIGRIMLSFIFLSSALGNKIPNFNQVTDYMKSEGVPAASFMLAGAIVFLLLGSISVILGFKARYGAGLLLVFLLLATYFFHDFWTIADAAARQMQMIQFMKNMALTGALLLIISNGSGALSLDKRIKSEKQKNQSE
jgi:putative oxidoreductase